jgi:ADP-ribose pyrophosphatase YjhB (NUDIX family)
VEASCVSCPNVSGVRALVIDADGRIFLVKHSYVSGWHLPGGGVEAGETLAQAVARELREEGNIEMTAPPRLHGIFFNNRASRRDHVALFVVRAFRQLAAPVPNGEIIAHGFFAADVHHRCDACAHRRSARRRAGMSGHGGGTNHASPAPPNWHVRS